MLLHMVDPSQAPTGQQVFVCRDRPVPIPAPGIQLVNLSHVEDLAEMLAAVPGNDSAVKQHFNLASDRAITFDGDLSGLQVCNHAYSSCC
jgi:nucleoside-diphosphate-sugar epimerase